MKEQIKDWNREPLRGLLLEPANLTQVEQMLANAKECLNWVSARQGGVLDYQFISYRLKRYLGLWDTFQNAFVSCYALKEIISFLELAIKLGLTGCCFIELAGHGMEGSMQAFEKEAIPGLMRPMGLYHDDDPLVEGFHEPKNGKSICRTSIGRKHPKRIRWTKGTEEVF